LIPTKGLKFGERLREETPFSPTERGVLILRVGAERDDSIEKGRLPSSAKRLLGSTETAPRG